MPDYGRVRHRFAQEAEGHFLHTWHHLSDREKDLIESIARCAPLRPSRAERDRLTHKCLVDGRGEIFSSSFARFVRDRALASKKDVGAGQPRYLAYELGLERMKIHLNPMQTEIFLDFAGLEQRLLENLDNERRFGSDDNVRSERARVIRELNRMARRHLEVSFNDLCRADHAERGAAPFVDEV